MCEFVGSIADDPTTKNIQNSTECNDTIIRESLSAPSISVISNVHNICRRLQRAMKETGLLNSQDIDRVEADSLDEEGEEMMTDDVKKGSIPMRLISQAQIEEQKYIEKMKVLEVVDRKEASGSNMIRTKMGCHEQRNNRQTKRLGSMGRNRSANGRPRLRALRSNSWTGSGEVCTQSHCGDWKERGSHCGSR